MGYEEETDTDAHHSVQTLKALFKKKQEGKNRFQRFLLKGKTKVKLEILLLCTGYNINNYIRKSRMKTKKSSVRIKKA